MKAELERQVAKACKELFAADINVELTRPEEQFGDYSTNVALQLAKQLGKNPREVAETLVAALRDELAEQISEVTVAGPGFINLKLSDEALIGSLKQAPDQVYKNQEIIVEFGDPNPFKAMHLGHLYSTIVGDTISSLLEAAGAKVERVSYHGDVGMHVAKASWHMRNFQHERQKEGKNISSIPLTERADFLSLSYAGGAHKYEEDKHAKKEIQEVNEHIYRQDDAEINELYQLGKEWSFKYFDKVFDELGVKFTKRYLESEATPIGVATVKKHLGDVFEESEGAVIFRGEKVGLHTRVFINSEGLPTYEAKDLGLVQLKNKDYPNADKSIIITAHEQAEYFKVMLAALSEFEPELAAKTQHIAHGFLSLTTGKMSSRTGDVHNAQTLLDDTLDAVEKAFPESKISRDVYIAAIKYAFLKNRIGGDIIYDPAESVSLEGNSGPYLQYAHARAQSILHKTDKAAELPTDTKLEAAERSLARKISEYSEVVNKAVAELMPHHVCTYLYELAQTFNRFYENNRVIGDLRQATRLSLVARYAQTLHDGLGLLGITAPDKM